MKLNILKSAAIVFGMAALLGVNVSAQAKEADPPEAAAIANQVRHLRYFTQPAGVKGSATPYGNNASAGHYVQAGDAKIYYEVYGKGKPFVVLHGGGVGSPYELGRILDLLRKDFKVVAVTTRGHGRSGIGHEPLSYEQKAEDVLVVLKEITDEPVILFGFSDGAYTSYKVAAMYPDRVERVVAIGAGTLQSGYFPPDMKVEDLEKADKAFMDQLRKLMPEPDRLQEFMSGYMAFWNKMKVDADPLARIKCPVLLIAGDEDDHAPLKTMQEAFQMIPNSRLCIVPKAWHTAFLDNFDVTWAAMKPFVYADVKTLQPSKKVIMK